MDEFDFETLLNSKRELELKRYSYIYRVDEFGSVWIMILWLTPLLLIISSNHCYFSMRMRIENYFFILYVCRIS